MAASAPPRPAVPNVAVPLHALFEAISDGVLITDAHGRRTYANPALRAMVGNDPTFPIGDSSAPSWLPEDQRKQYHEVIQRTANSLPGSEVVVLEWSVLDRAGNALPVVTRLLPVRGSNGDPAAVLWLLQSAESADQSAVRELQGALQRIAGEVERLGIGSQARPPATVENFDGAERLTRREREVVDCLLQGERVVSMAERLGVSSHTVRNHLKSIFRKLDVHSQADLVRHVRGRS
jgi:PAS domain S-box-containing protein